MTMPPTLTMVALPMVTMALALKLTSTMASPILRVVVGAVMSSRTAASVRLGPG